MIRIFHYLYLDELRITSLNIFCLLLIYVDSFMNPVLSKILIADAMNDIYKQNAELLIVKQAIYKLKELWQ